MGGDRYKNVGGNTWVHVDIPTVSFPRKPPDWLEEILLRIYGHGIAKGERNVKEKISLALGFLTEHLEGDP